MFKEKLKTDHPFISEFLTSAFSKESGKFSHAYMLTGSNPLAQYFIALETARVLNCEYKSQTTADCNCTNCSWIRQNRHPAVITVSPVDYTHGNKDGKAMTVISVNQARYLKESLATASNYHRIVIFTDAKEGAECKRVAQRLWQDYEEIISAPAIDSEKIRENWIPAPLNRKILSTEAANTLLKIVEEPPPNLLFFFLTRDKEDIIETIVSRTQVLPVNAQIKSQTDYEILDNFFNKFPPKSVGEAVLFSERLIQISKEESYSPEELLDNIQSYLSQTARQNVQDKSLCFRLNEYIRKIEKAKQELKSHVNLNSAMDNLFLSFLK